MLSMEAHQNKVCSSGLHNRRRIRKYLSQDCLVTLIHASSSRVGWKIAIASCMVSRSVKFQNYMQRVQNAAARIALDLSKFCHITVLQCDSFTGYLASHADVLRGSSRVPPNPKNVCVGGYWLSVVKRIQFKILHLTFKAIQGYSRSLSFLPSVNL